MSDLLSSVQQRVRFLLGEGVGAPDDDDGEDGVDGVRTEYLRNEYL